MSYEELVRIGDGTAGQKQPIGQAHCGAKEETGRNRFQIRRQNRRTRNLSQRRTGQSDRQSGLRSDGTARTPTRERTQAPPSRTGRKEGRRSAAQEVIATSGSHFERNPGGPSSS